MPLDIASPLGPYQHAAPIYWLKGWRGVLPLPYAAKDPPPSGYTGTGGLTPSRVDIQTWCDTQGNSNIALRMPADIIGFDVDAYGSKAGGHTLEIKSKELGALPPTWRSTSRDDALSGIYFYRVDPGLYWPGEIGPGVEIIQLRHRYAVVWPSVHPEQRVYRWIDPEGATSDIPNPQWFPVLPPLWAESLTGLQAARDIPRLAVTHAIARAYIGEFPAGPSCRRISATVDHALAALSASVGSRHDAALRWVLALTFQAAEGHHGAAHGLERVKAGWLDAVSSDGSREPAKAAREWASIERGAIGIVRAEHARIAQGDPCELDPFEGIIMPSPNGAISNAGTIEPRHESASTSNRRLETRDFASTQMSKVRWAWDERIPIGTLALLAGKQGLGKSTLAYWLAARISRGELAGEFVGKPCNVLVYATEDSIPHTIAPRLVAANADMQKVHWLEMKSHDDITLGLTLPDDFVYIDRACREKDAALLILDPLMSRLSYKLDTYRDGEVRRALEPIKRLAEDTGSVILGIVHHIKGTSTDPLDAIMGSTAFTAVARSVHTVIRDPEDDTGARRLFGTPKSNLGRTDLPTKTFTIVGQQVAVMDGMTSVSKIEWGRDIALSIADAMSNATMTPEQRDARTSAHDWLVRYLEQQGGEAMVRDIPTKQAGNGPYSKRTLERVVSGSSLIASVSVPLMDAPQTRKYVLRVTID